MKKYELKLNEENIKDTIENDVLGRNERIINLIKLLNNIDEDFIISVDGAWGSGKTFFLKQLIYISQNYESISIFKTEQKNIIRDFSSKHLIVYYNAWENDDHENPIESLIYSILNEYPKMKKYIHNPEELFSSAKPILMNLIDKLTSGVITSECFQNLKSFEELAKHIITIEEKKDKFNELINKLLSSNERILLIIDELDRCKPDYAVKMLETIKHFYNSKNITIIVSTNNDQLSKNINHFYGYGFDGYGYLNKIYDTIIRLEIENLENYVKHFCEIMKKTWLPENISYLLFMYFRFSYRECNKYMSMYRIIEPYTNYTYGYYQNKYSFESCIILPMTIALKVKNITKYIEFIEGNGEDIIKKFIVFVKETDDSGRYIRLFNELLSVSEGENLAEKSIDRYKSIFNEKNQYDKFPYMEAISMLGNRISLSEIKKKNN